jgi:hypothetical protein
MDPKEYWFRVSLTAKVWLQLEEGVPYYEYEEPSEEFVASYKETYITGRQRLEEHNR